MIRRVYRWYVRRHRDYKFRGYLAWYEQKQRESGGGTVVWGHPLAIFGYFAGRGMRRDLRRESPHSGVVGRLVARFHGPVGFLVMLAVGALGYTALARLVGQSGTKLPLAPVLFASIPIVHSHYLARQDLKEVKELRKTSDANALASIDRAYDRLSHRQPAVRAAAIRVLRKCFEQSPGKAVKYLDGDPPEVRDALLAALDAEDAAGTEHALVCLKWFSRDYGQLLIEDGGAIAAYLDSGNSALQAHAAVAVGNIGRRDPERTAEYAGVLTGAVKDPDAEVRHAAAVALGSLPCERAGKMLKYLTEDSDPDVRRQAEEGLKQVVAALNDQ
ncbi:uncharacterized protein HHUB_3027 [Halobacterium hubeiense]|uniref:HEAT repeat domain-containing protein n=1 Tax=Halobacterium hubeiense TaxID=1407499 RepID=A0A0U5CZR0_9EURY|nr:HEAT repeat domain-containing protein [Halobacterium hubeiense]CQH59640.1 uncharacterized protein HHUB_3027 [Halobacterium hubeiense]